MGTRGTIGVRSNGNLYGVYNHFDSYPESLGQEIVNFCKTLDSNSISDLKEKFSKVVVVDEKDIAPVEEQERYIAAGFFNGNVADGQTYNWYCLLRNIQGIEYIKTVQSGACQHWIDGLAFLQDSLFCEYAYILNLDDEVLEFYEGFNKEADENSPLPYEQVADKDGYYPVRFKGNVALDAIPENWIKEFYSREE